MARFKDLLYDFMQGLFRTVYPAMPTKIEFSLFQDPDLDFSEPRIEIHVPSVEGFSRSMLHERFARGLKEFLASRSKDLADFMELRELQREFITVFKPLYRFYEGQAIQRVIDNHNNHRHVQDNKGMSGYLQWDVPRSLLARETCKKHVHSSPSTRSIN